MDQIFTFLTDNLAYSPQIVFFLILLAGCNIPISIDIIIASSALISAKLAPELALSLYISSLVSCYLSAIICFWIGRLLGNKIHQFKYFQKILPQRRLDRIKKFYEIYGLATLVIGRFIPFGFRNCLFLSTGMSKSNFSKFMARDALACFVWVSLCFLVWFQLGTNFDSIFKSIKEINIYIFSFFGVTVIGIICYKGLSSRKTISEQ